MKKHVELQEELLFMLNPIYCPNCHRPATVQQDYIEPREEDIIICVHCAHPYLFDERMRLRPITDKEIKEVMKKEPSIYLAICQAQYNIYGKVLI